MSLKDWYHTLNKKCLEDIPEVQYIDYIVSKRNIWTTISQTRVKPFYYCSKPSTKRWKR